LSHVSLNIFFFFFFLLLLFFRKFGRNTFAYGGDLKKCPVLVEHFEKTLLCLLGKLFGCLCLLEVMKGLGDRTSVSPVWGGQTEGKIAIHF
jgi:hypothetical protein